MHGGPGLLGRMPGGSMGPSQRRFAQRAIRAANPHGRLIDGAPAHWPDMRARDDGALTEVGCRPAGPPRRAS
jgi:hypothetical protein